MNEINGWDCVENNGEIFAVWPATRKKLKKKQREETAEEFDRRMELDRMDHFDAENNS